MRYPIPSTQEWNANTNLSIIGRARAALWEIQHRLQAKSRKGLTLDLVYAAAEHVGPNDVVLLCVARNAVKYVPSFLTHYRRLGIRRFAFLDDKSDDGTRELLRQPDVDLYGSNVDFRTADGGLAWRDMLVERYGRNRWYVSVDSDEYLVFPGSETRTVQDFVADLERGSLKRAMAVMLDIYPDGPLSSAPPHRPPEAPPTDICPLYDGEGYDMEQGRYCTSVRGGPRRRMFGLRMRLNKFPVLFMDVRARFGGGTHHSPLPVDRNFSAVHAVLLHYKFPADAAADFRAIAERGMHADGAKYYKAMLAHEKFDGSTDFRCASSTRYEGSQKLIDEGFMQDLRAGIASR